MTTAHLPSASPAASHCDLSRRDMLKLLGTGIVVCVVGTPGTANAEQLPNSFLRIDPGGRVTVYTSKVELGQGVKTAFAQIAAEELDAPLESVEVIGGDTALCAPDPNGQETWGSLSISDAGPRLRSAAARARALLIKLAAQQLSLPESQLLTANGFVYDKEVPATRISYGALAGAGTPNLPVTATNKSPANYTICGKSAIRHDAIEKVTGKAFFAGDIRLPGMLYARIVRAPFFGGTFKSPPDTTKAEEIPGVQVARIGTNLVAVLHELPDVVEKALALVKAEFNPPATGPSDQTIHQAILSGPAPNRAVERRKPVEWTLAGHGRTECNLLHALRGPCVHGDPRHAGLFRRWQSARLGFDASPYQIRQQVASAVGVTLANVHVITPFVGGAFGGKSLTTDTPSRPLDSQRPSANQLMLLGHARKTFSWSNSNPLLISINAGLDAAGSVSYWDSKSYFTGNGSMARIYDFINHRTVFMGTPAAGSPPFPTGAWRAPGTAF
jgi:isoquinoline 1-oxidoreductase